MDNKNKGKGKMEKKDDTKVIDTKELIPMFTCVICFKILNVATALTDCLHRFCWKCISGKIMKHDWNCCPVCYADLGSRPLGKIRYDYSFDRLKKTFFPEQEERKEYVETASETSEASSSSSDNSKASSSSLDISEASSSSSDNSKASSSSLDNSEASSSSSDNSEASSSSSDNSEASSSSSDSSDQAPEQEDIEDFNPYLRARKRYKATYE